MIYAEIRQSLPALSKDEREALAVLDDPAYLAEITRRGDRRGAAAALRG